MIGCAYERSHVRDMAVDGSPPPVPQHALAYKPEANSSVGA